MNVVHKMAGLHSPKVAFVKESESSHRDLRTPGPEGSGFRASKESDAEALAGSGTRWER
jgi:hypothetical protein